MKCHECNGKVTPDCKIIYGELACKHYVDIFICDGCLDEYNKKCGFKVREVLRQSQADSEAVAENR